MTTTTSTVTTATDGNAPSSRTVEATFNYWSSQRKLDGSVTEAIAVVNRQVDDMKPRICVVHDIRATKEWYNLDDHGFMVLQQPSALLPPQWSGKEAPSFQDKELVVEKYLPELVALLKEKLPVRYVHPFDAVPRQSANSAIIGVGDTKPFFLAHNDYSPAGMRTIMRNMLPSYHDDLVAAGKTSLTSDAERKTFWALREEILSHEAQEIEKSGAASHLDWDGSNYTGPRWQVFSLWRPLEQVKADPLAVLNARSTFVGPDFQLGHYNNNYHPFQESRSYVQLLLPHVSKAGMPEFYNSQNIMPLHPEMPGYKEQLQKEGKEHEWLYLHEQRPDEVLVLKIFDSDAWVKDKRGKVMPNGAHSAFALPSQDPDAIRKSMEARFIVIY